MSPRPAAIARPSLDGADEHLDPQGAGGGAVVAPLQHLVEDHRVLGAK